MTEESLPIKEEKVEDQTVTTPPLADEADSTPIKSEPEKPPKICFKCKSCAFAEWCDYKGMQPPFAKKVQFYEECYVMQDPFSPPPGKSSDKSNSEYFIVLGSDCSSCRNSVCASGSCSIYYGQTLCLQCAYQNIARFPLEIQSKIKKLISLSEV